MTKSNACSCLYFPPSIFPNFHFVSYRCFLCTVKSLNVLGFLCSCCIFRRERAGGGSGRTYASLNRRRLRLDSIGCLLPAPLLSGEKNRKHASSKNPSSPSPREPNRLSNTPCHATVSIKSAFLYRTQWSRPVSELWGPRAGGGAPSGDPGVTLIRWWSKSFKPRGRRPCLKRALIISG